MCHLIAIVNREQVEEVKQAVAVLITTSSLRACKEMGMKWL